MKVIGKRYSGKVTMYDVRTVTVADGKIYINLFMVKGINYKTLTITNAI